MGMSVKKLVWIGAAMILVAGSLKALAPATAKRQVPTVDDATRLLEAVYKSNNLSCFRIPALPAVRTFSYMPGEARSFSPPSPPTLAELAEAGVLRHERREEPTADSPQRIEVSERFTIAPGYERDYSEYSEVPGHPFGRLCFAKISVIGVDSMEYSGPHQGSYRATLRIRLDPFDWVSRLRPASLSRVEAMFSATGARIAAPLCAEAGRLTYGTLCKGTRSNDPSMHLFLTHIAGDGYDGYGEFSRE